MYESSPQQVARVVDYAAYFLMGELFEYGKGNELFQVLKDKRTSDYVTGRFG